LSFRLAHILVYKLPFILQGKEKYFHLREKSLSMLIFLAAWKLIKSWLPVETQKTVIFVDEKTIFQYVPRDQIPSEVGGFATPNS
jgi:hypothetical protein